MKDEMRTFESGATRNVEEGKLDFEGFLSPAVLERYAQYLAKHQKQADGKMRESDNWQKGIPKDVYIKSSLRHFIDVWKQHRGLEGQDTLQDSLCAVLFNVMGYLFEDLKLGHKSKPEPKITDQYYRGPEGNIYHRINPLQVKCVHVDPGSFGWSTGDTDKLDNLTGLKPCTKEGKPL